MRGSGSKMRAKNRSVVWRWDVIIDFDKHLHDINQTPSDEEGCEMLLKALEKVSKWTLGYYVQTNKDPRI